MYFSAGLKSSYKPCSKKFGLSIWVPILIHRYKYASGYDTVRFSNLATMTLVQWLSQIIYHTYWENFSWNLSDWNEVNVQWIYPGSISDSNITEKNLVWLAELRKSMKSCQRKGSLNSSCQKNDPVFRSWRSC